VAIDQHHAGTAGSGATAKPGRLEPKIVAQGVEQRRVPIGVNVDLVAVDRNTQLDHILQSFVAYP
jgi:hypothetical protein